MPHGPIDVAGSSAVLMPDHEEGRRFLNALDSTALDWVFQTFDDSDQRRPLARTLRGSLDDSGPELVALNAAGAGIFVTINEVKLGQRRLAENVVRVRAVFVDCDQPARSSELWPKIKQYGLAPSIIVETSPNKFHVYWLVGDCPLNLFKPAQQRLAELFGTDPSVCDLPRVMRLPGFIHQKHAPFRSRLVTPP